MLLFNNNSKFINGWRIGIFNRIFHPGQNNGVSFTQTTTNLISQGICPICGKNKAAEIKLKIGYEPALDSTSNIFIKFVGKHFYKEIIGYIQICEQCKDDFLAFRLSDPSKTLLTHRKGLRRGLANPYSHENIIYPDPPLPNNS
jgi:hypothetical protein